LTSVLPLLPGGDVSVKGTKKFVKANYEEKQTFQGQTGDFVE
jgi:hypothetical protein